MNLIYLTLQQIQMNDWYGLSPEMEIAKGRNKIGNRLHKIKRRIITFLYKIRHK